MTAGVNFTSDGGTATNPCVSHGTSVASLAAGNTVGVARGATIVPLRVSRCDYNQGAVELFAAISALDYVIQQRQTYGRPSVVNMSFFQEDPWDDIYECPDQEGNPGGSCIRHGLEAQVRQAINAGITVVVSGNNQNQNRCVVQSPARMGYGNEASYPSTQRTITVGGTDINDQRYVCPTCQASDPGSNYGPCISFYAPAHKIRSADTQSTASYRDHTVENGSSGTSFAAPLVTGAVARWLEQYPWLTPQDVWYWLYQTAKNLDSVPDFDSDGIPGNNKLLRIDPYH